MICFLKRKIDSSMFSSLISLFLILNCLPETLLKMLLEPSFRFTSILVSMFSFIYVSSPVGLYSLVGLFLTW